MRDRFRIRVTTVLATPTLTLLASAQTTFPESEPNGTKDEATAASCMRAGDALTGLSTGSSTAPASPADASADTFRIRTCALPRGIYRHTLTITSTGPVDHVGTLRGRNQFGTVGVGGTIGPLDTVAQTSSVTNPVRTNTWYGFGKQEEIYYRIAGTAATTAGYSVTLATTQVTPTAVAGAFAPGPITITTVGQGHSTDTDIYVYDAELDPVPTAQNDDELGTTSLQSRLTRTLGAGTYFLALGTYDTCNSEAAPADDDWVGGTVLDFPDALSNSVSLASAIQLGFSISDGTTTTPVAIARASPYEIAWVQFTVGAPTPPQAFCFGDGSGAPCPCSPAPVPHGSAGNGCPSSLFAGGANLAATGTASLAADSLVLTGTSMPNSSALYFQGTAQNAAGTAFGDGLRCAAGTIIRLGTKANALNASSYPEAGDLPVSVRGLVSAGGSLRTYQCWYRNSDPSFCTAATFNLTNGLAVVWIP